MEFWNSLLTEKSWKILQEFSRKYKFTLIGGWAVYLWARQQKSKDIDIVVDIKELQKLKQENLAKNDRLRKYEIKIDEIDIDIYVSYFSTLVIPAENIIKYTSKLEGFNVVIPEALLVLKQGAEIDRRHSIKGEKDMIDIMSLLLLGKIDFSIYRDILREHKLEGYIGELISLIRSFQDYSVFSLSPRELKLRKKSIIDELKKL